MVEISVVIPTYNYGKYIKCAIESVLKQTYKDFEIVVVDDGSTDNTKEILYQYFSQIQYYHIQNSGPAHARNFGIENSKGKYIAFLDADDIWVNTKLEKQIEVFRKNKEVGMVFTECEVFKGNKVLKKKMGKKKLMKGDLASNIFIFSGVATPTVMVKKKVFENLGKFEESLTCAEDDNMWIRIASNYEVVLIDESLVMVRKHNENITIDINLILDDVKKNIEYLCSKYGDRVKNKILPKIRKKKSKIFLARGYYHFSVNNYSVAKNEFSRSLKFDFLNITTWYYWGLCFFPEYLLNFLKRVKNIFSQKILQERDFE